MSLFTQKHFEFFVRELQKESPEQRECAMEFLCRAFQQDNPFFKPMMFRALLISRRRPPQEKQP